MRHIYDDDLEYICGAVRTFFIHSLVNTSLKFLLKLAKLSLCKFQNFLHGSGNSWTKAFQMYFGVIIVDLSYSSYLKSMEPMFPFAAFQINIE